MHPHKQVVILREAGKTERCHTLPHHGSYTVGQHSFDAVNLILCLHPNPSMNLVKAILWHDAPERWIGDTPATALWADVEFAMAYARLEERGLEAMGLSVELTDDEKLWLRACDKVELLLWAKDQVALGNVNANVVIGNLVSWFQHNEIPVQVKQFVEQHTWHRSIEHLPPEVRKS